MVRGTFKTSVLVFVLALWGLFSQGLPASPEIGRSVDPPIAQEGSFKITYDVPLIGQVTEFSCWAAGIAMLASWREGESITPEDIAEPVSYVRDFESKTGLGNGLRLDDTSFFQRWDLICEQPQTFTVEGFKNLLETYGPLWVATSEPGTHARVVTGMSGDGTAEGTYLMINDPWKEDSEGNVILGKGSRYEETYFEFVRKQSNLAISTLKLAKPVYVVHCKKTEE